MAPLFVFCECKCRAFILHTQTFCKKNAKILCEYVFCTIFASVNNEKVGFYAEMFILYCFFITFAANDEIYSSSKMAECSAVGSALRSGRRGRAFESPHSDTRRQTVKIVCRFFFFISVSA